MGINFYVPIFILFLTIVITIISRCKKFEIDSVLLIYQMIIPIFSSWWSIFILYELFEQDGGELILTYQSNKLRVGIFSNIKYFLINALISSIFVYLNLKIFYDYFNVYFILQLVFQSLFFSSFAFLLISIIKNLGWTIFIIVSYFSIMFFLGHGIIVLPNIYYFKEGYINKNGCEYIIFKSITYSFVYYSIGQIIFNETSTKLKSFK